VDRAENDGDESILDAFNRLVAAGTTVVVIAVVVRMVSETRCREWPDAWWAARLGNNRLMEDDGCLVRITFRRAQHRFESRGQFLGVYA